MFSQIEQDKCRHSFEHSRHSVSRIASFADSPSTFQVTLNMFDSVQCH